MKNKGLYPDNPIILEGLWGLGKTTLTQEYSRKHDYKPLFEPLHTTDQTVQQLANNLDTWYIQAHQAREAYLKGQLPVIMERSILSTFAFLYALKRPLPNTFHIDRLRRLIENKKILVVYLKPQKNILTWEKNELQKYSQDIQSILTDKQKKLRYEEWYEKVLTQKYGILPFFLRLTKNNARLEADKLVNRIHHVLISRRIAQVNVVCFTTSVNSQEIRILLLKRSVKKGGFFQTVTGGIHPGESPLHAARRELLEETNMAKKAINIFWTPFTYSFTGNDNYELDEYVFGCNIQNPNLIQISKEHENFKWVTIAQAKKMLKFKENKIAIDEVLKKIGRPNQELP